LVLARMTAVMALGVAPAAPAADAAAVALLQQRAALQARLQASPIGQPMLLDSREQPDSLSGEVHAELPVPVGRLQALFGSGAAMCEMLLLHLNVRACQAPGVVGSGSIVLLVGPQAAGRRGTAAPHGLSGEGRCRRHRRRAADAVRQHRASGHA
jgi:hypothetical protein